MSEFQGGRESDSVVSNTCNLHSFVLVAVAEAGRNYDLIVHCPAARIIDCELRASALRSLGETSGH